MITRLPLLRVGRAGFGSQARRCITYDKSALTDEALQKQVEAALKDGTDGDDIRLNPETKTIKTAAGDLPISPIFDIDWMKARRRQRKDEADKPIGRFRKKLTNNPYAQALATPIRRCCRTNVMLPRYFLQDFEVVQQPSKDSLWWAPGTLAFKDLATTSKHSKSPTDSTCRRRSPVTGYMLSRNIVFGVGKAGNQKKTHGPNLAGSRTGMAMSPRISKAVWREDMGDAVLKLMRCLATDALIAASIHRKHQDLQNLQPCKWEEVGDVKLRGCVLWLRGEEKAEVPVATMKVDGAKYGQTMAVHDLNWILGVEEVQRLKGSSETFKNHDVLVLRQEQSESIMALHLLLWKLQGYLARP
ncbi:hypothetical protein E4U17_002718 [Claviceps sp. LM77 group G4]|nr:hypothetical protein E4U17_002718 [Claviceps sp. LM77 group G4]KAG6077677.1 hypothetical protein E4U16_002061 [Claviceps sp. LM84 group G4]KAG6083586.1 hypothetical protein E4U33_004594 [Claviceps sp. LM78 group G4]